MNKVGRDVIYFTNKYTKVSSFVSCQILKLNKLEGEKKAKLSISM